MPDSVSFIFVCCQTGAEATCKQEILSQHPGLRFAFSRPGFLTFKVVDAVIRPDEFRLTSTFARVWGWSVGKAKEDDRQTLAGMICQQIVNLPNAENFKQLHVWQRDTSMPGRNGFEPGISPVAAEASRILAENLQSQLPGIQVNEVAELGDQTLCIIMVEANEWWIAWHESTQVSQTWPGGVPPIQMPQTCVNRAWLKIHEAILWAEVQIQKNDTIVEIGSAPGGASQYLLERGAKVVAIDPAEMDPLVADHPSLQHVRRRARDVPNRQLQDATWLTIDVNMPPSYTIQVIRDYIMDRGLRVKGVIATLKLPDWKLAAEIEDYRLQFEQMGFRLVKSRQLAFNRQELCVVAQRKPGRKTRVTN